MKRLTTPTVWHTAKAGDKLAYYVGCGAYGATRPLRAILVKLPAIIGGKVTIKIRLSNGMGEIRWQQKRVSAEKLWLYDWPETGRMNDVVFSAIMPPVNVEGWNPELAEGMSEGEFMHMTVDNLRSGRLTNNCRLTESELDAMQAEIIGLEFSTRPFQF